MGFDDKELRFSKTIKCQTVAIASITQLFSTRSDFMSDLTIQIISAVEDDRAFFVHAHHTAYRWAIEEMFGWDELVQDNYASAAFDGGGIHVIWNKGKRIGVVGWELKMDCLWLKEFYILPTYQGQGIGSYVVEQTIKQSIDLGKDLALRTLRVNAQAKMLYERLGLSVTDKTDIHWIMGRSVLG